MPNNIERPACFVPVFCSRPTCTRAVWVYPEVRDRLLSGSAPEWWRMSVVVCESCDAPARRPIGAGHSGHVYRDDPSPWEENAVRALEDGME